jgi:integrase
MAEVRHDEFVFPGAKQGRSLTRNGLLWLFEHLGLKITSHGFRSSFRDWVAEATTFPREAAELALAHAVGDSVERAYQRGDLLEKRRKLMDAWATYCARKTANVIPIKGFDVVQPRG